MKTAQFNDAQIMGILKQAEGETPVSALCQEYGMSHPNFYNWRANFSGMDASLLVEMKNMVEQNRRPKRMYAEMSMLKEALRSATCCAICPSGNGAQYGRLVDERWP